MGEAFILRHGAFGVKINAAVIHVSVEKGSTVKFSKGGIIVETQGPSDAIVSGNTGNYYYSVRSGNYGSWTVTATSGTKTANKTITINAAQQYDVTLLYGLYIFKSGTGLNPSYTVHRTRDGGDTFYIDTTSFGGTKNYAGAILYFTPKVDITKYSKLCVDQICYSRYQDQSRYKVYVGIGNNTTGSSDENPSSDLARSAQYNTTRATYKISLASVSKGQYYVKVHGGAVHFSIYNLWFEQ